MNRVKENWQLTVIVITSLVLFIMWWVLTHFGLQITGPAWTVLCFLLAVVMGGAILVDLVVFLVLRWLDSGNTGPAWQPR